MAQAGRFAGKAAIVTGGSSGIGLAIARRLAAEGAAVAVAARREDALAAAVAGIRESGGRAHGVRCDVGQPAAVAAMVAEVLATFGAVDVLVNNAGHRSRQPFWEIADEEWDAVLGTVLGGAFSCSRAVVRHWLATGARGRIVNIGSIAAERATPGQAHYATAKGGLRLLTRTMAVELAPHGIPVNCVDPGAIATPMIADRLQSEEDLAFYATRIPWGSVGAPDDIASAVAFLASDEARYMTGASIAVDGGWLAA
jgi:glucose 1-dehydrogenase